MWKYGNVFLRQKFLNWKHSVSWRLIVLQHPIVCNVLSDSLDTFSKSFQDIFVEVMINCLSWRYKFFVHNATAVEKNNNHGFHPGSAHVCFLRMTRTFHVPFLPHFAIWSRDRNRTPMIHLLLLLYAKNLAQFRVFPANPDKFPTSSLFAQISFLAPILHKFFTCANVLLEFHEPHFYSSPFLLQSSWHSIGGLSPSQLAPLPHFDHFLKRLVFKNEGCLQHFLGPLWKLCAT